MINVFQYFNWNFGIKTSHNPVISPSKQYVIAQPKNYMPLTGAVSDTFIFKSDVFTYTVGNITFHDISLVM